MAGRRVFAGCAAFAAALLMLALGSISPARAFDLSSLDPFEWFGGSEKGPESSTTALPYKVTFAVNGSDDTKALTRALQDASNLYKLRSNAPPDGDALVRRAIADSEPLTDALWASGYFNARVTIAVAGFPVADERPALAAHHAAETFRNRAPVPITITAETGPLFRIKAVSLVVKGGAAGDPVFADAGKATGLGPGEPATSALIRAGQAKVVDALRSRSYPLARIVAVRPMVDHAALTMEIEIEIDSGRKAGFGEITVTSPQTINPSIVRSYIYLEDGQPYTPKDVADTRKSIAKIPAVGSVRIREAASLDANNNLPLSVDVTERPRHLLGAAARYSTIDGPALKTYWEDRNLFGGAERLRLDAETFLAPRIDGSSLKGFDDLRRSDIGARFSFAFEKPALAGTRNDLVIGGSAVRERIGDNRVGGYTARYFDGTVGIRHRFSDTVSVQAGIEGETGQTSDVLGQVNYTLLGVPLSAKYDSTDNLLDPTQGVRIAASLTPYAALSGRSDGFVQSKLAASTYYAVDEDARYVLAARLGLGSITGSDLADIPSTHRFYAGGSGSVRGYAYRTLSPLSPGGQLIGGRSLIDGSLEARIKVTETIGVVPFIDAGSAFRSTFPDFDQTVALGAGIGFRYYTPIGPIRLDVATPLNPRRGDKPIVVYISVGQAF